MLNSTTHTHTNNFYEGHWEIYEINVLNNKGKQISMRGYIDEKVIVHVPDTEAKQAMDITDF